MVYAQAAEGFRPGFGLSDIPTACDDDLILLGLTTQPTQVDPDRLWNYEVGAKSEWLDNQLRVNVSAYQIDWEDIQNSVFLPCGFPLIANLGDVRNRGAELEINAQLGQSTTVGVSTGYVDSAFQQDIFGILGTKGQPIPDVPEWTGSVFLQYDFEAFGNWQGLVRSDVSYTSESLSVYGPASPNVPDKGSLSLWDARLEFERDRLKIALFARNILDDVERTALVRSVSLNIPSRLRYAVNRPRVVGINVVWHY
jgi:outer membrane receptor protein involved in Fe transport